MNNCNQLYCNGPCIFKFYLVLKLRYCTVLYCKGTGAISGMVLAARGILDGFWMDCRWIVDRLLLVCGWIVDGFEMNLDGCWHNFSMILDKFLQQHLQNADAAWHETKTR